MRASEALGKSEGLFLRPTQADRTRVGEGYLGGPGFSGLQLTDPAYRDAAAAWAVKNKGAAKTIVNANKMNEGKNVWSTMLGSPTQHHSNQMVFDTLHHDFMDKVAEGKLSPELREKINDKLASAVTKKGEPVFPSDVDIASPEFKDLANTFDRRSIAATLMSGQTVGGKKGMIIDYPGHMKAASDPGLIDAPTGAIGNRLFTMSNEVMTRPDLHPAFPTVLAGEDLGMNYTPVPRNIMLPDYYKEFNTRKGRDPGVMDLTRGYAPSQQLSEEFLTSLQKQGYKKGGAVKHPRHDEFVAKIKQKLTQVKKMAEGGAVDYNSTPDMSDGGQLIQAPAYKAGGKVKPQVKISNNLDTMLMELSNKRNK